MKSKSLLPHTPNTDEKYSKDGDFIIRHENNIASPIKIRFFLNNVDLTVASRVCKQWHNFFSPKHQLKIENFSGTPDISHVSLNKEIKLPNNTVQKVPFSRGIHRKAYGTLILSNKIITTAAENIVFDKAFIGFFNSTTGSKEYEYPTNSFEVEYITIRLTVFAWVCLLLADFVEIPLALTCSA